MRNKQLQFRNAFAFLAVATFLWVGPPAIAQSPQDNPPARQDNDRDRQDTDRNRQEMASFDQFLDGHKQVSQELRGDPSRIRDSSFLAKYPELQTYLQNHPAVQRQLTENPNGFMSAIERKDYQEQFGPGSTRRDPDVTRRELSSFNQFLGAHQQISQELRGDPSRIRDNQFLQKYPELQTYLQNHPAVREELNENPNSFMYAEQNVQNRNSTDADKNRTDADRDRRDADNRNRTDADRNRTDADRDRTDADNRNRADADRNRTDADRNRTDADRDRTDADNRNRTDADRDRVARSDNDARRDNDARADNRSAGRRDNDVTRGELSSFDQFLDHHHEIGEQLRKDPSLVNNQKWVQEHPALQTYLQDHKGVREELTENPKSFMTAENRSGDNRWNRDADRNDMRRGDSDSFRDFLGSHSSIAKDLRKKPALAQNQQYLQKHPEFQEYLNAHPGVQSALSQDPANFMKSTTTTKATTDTTTGTTTTTKPPKP